uniref:Disease resistance protein winged helix domain-containing protein n=1 Tax=Leersia perrieri TaxID=77586 RepID=A0A0D9XUV8_9ORYZ
MLLHLLYVNPYRSSTQMGNLSKALAEHRNNIFRTMLMFCYNDMPIKYKTCLHYLSIFPRRTRLIRRWLTEGLVTKRRLSAANNDSCRVVQLEDQAERIFTTLIDRGFLHPGETSDAGKMKTCTMHHIVHEFIAMDVSSFMDSCLPLDLAHRLNINSGVILEGVSPSNTILTSASPDATQLPKQIEKLQCLETLDIRQTEIRAFATKSVLLPMLKHFLAGNKDPQSSSNNKSCTSEESLATV